MAEDFAVHLFEHAEVLALLGRRGDQVVHHPVEVLEAAGGRLDRVAADVLGQHGRVDGARRVLPAEPEERVLDLLGRPLVERLLLVLGGLRPGDRLVPPLDGEVVVRGQDRDQALDVVLRLGDVVEPAVGHDRPDAAVDLAELRVAELADRVRLAGPVVVPQAERVPDLVAADVPEQLAGQLVR